MNHTRTKTYTYRAAALLAASALAGAAPMTALAGVFTRPNDNYAVAEPPAPDTGKDISPDFAYSAQKWASLRDNVMDYGEVADLIHEYNPTVRSNRSTLNDQKKQSLTQINDQLLDNARDLWNDAGNADSDSYLGRMQAAQLNFAGDTLARSADQNYMDADMYKISYAQTEANLVFQAQQLMATYEQSAYAMENLNAGKALAQASYDAAVARRSVGVATDTDVLTARKNVQDIDANIQSAQKSADNVHRSLCLMLGWDADAQPQIQAVPAPDLDRIAAMNPEGDKEQAIANNYDVKFNEQKLKNLSSQDLIASTNATLDDDRNKVYSSLKTQYNTVLDAKEALESANQKLELETVNMNTASVKAAAGELSSLDLLSQKNAWTTAKNNVETGKMQLFLAMEKYDWIKKGLTF